MDDYILTAFELITLVLFILGILVILMAKK